MSRKLASKNKSSNTTAQFSKKDQLIAELEEELEKERDKRNEQKFYWLASVFFLLDVLKFEEWHWMVSLAFLLFQVTILIVLAKKWGVEEFALQIEKLQSLIRDCAAKK